MTSHEMVTHIEKAARFEPAPERLPNEFPRTIIAGGMGGSASAALALSYLLPERSITVHEDYDLPVHAPADALYLAISYSGNTEETLSFARAALERGLPLGIISSGGELLALAREKGLPAVAVPEGQAPRDALLPMTRAGLALLAEQGLLQELASNVPAESDITGAIGKLAEALEQKTPIFYASAQSALFTRIAKMYWNESAKEPAFASVVPARNHDELQSFGAAEAARYAIVLFRGKDDPRTARRLAVMAEYLPELGVSVHELALPEDSAAKRLVWGWVVLHEAAREHARRRGVSPDGAPITETFKKRL